MPDVEAPCEAIVAPIREATETVETVIRLLQNKVNARGNVIATIIVNLRKGAAPEEVLKWFDEHGKGMLDG